MEYFFIKIILERANAYNFIYEKKLAFVVLRNILNFFANSQYVLESKLLYSYTIQNNATKCTYDQPSKARGHTKLFIRQVFQKYFENVYYYNIFFVSFILYLSKEVLNFLDLR